MNRENFCQNGEKMSGIESGIKRVSSDSLSVSIGEGSLSFVEETDKLSGSMNTLNITIY